ncbi:MAG: hypothetical protein ACXWDN_17690, partial [Limisphaerales bacterium]
MNLRGICGRAGNSPYFVLLVTLAQLFLGGTSLVATETFSNQDCLDCHTDPTTSRMVNGKSVPIAVFPTNIFKATIHGKLNCVDCHRGFKDLVHEAHP